MYLWTQIVDRVMPNAALAPSARELLILLGLVLAVVVLGPAWRAARLAVTLVHELGHAIVGTAVIVAGAAGWAPPVLALALLILIGSILRIRSFLTALVLLGTIALAGYLWWFADSRWQGLALLVNGGILLVGAWRHLGALARDRSRGSDPAVLATLTPLPRWVWMVTFVLACGAASWLAVTVVLSVLP